MSELEEQGAEFDLTPMVPADQMAAFQHAGFWRSVLPRYKEDSKSDYTDYSHLPSVMLVLLPCQCLNATQVLQDAAAQYCRDALHRMFGMSAGKMMRQDDEDADLRA